MESSFHWVDYLIFGLSLFLSASIGVWFACTGKKASTTEEFLMAGRNMPVFPVSVSMFVSWISAISFLGDPVEVYSHGSVYIFLGVGYLLAVPVVAQYFAPKLHKLNLVSVFQFLEDKYNKPIRLLGALLCIVITESWLAVVLYAPSLAFSQVSGIPVTVSILSIGLVCTFYTTIGGMKAVLWADTAQMVIMVAGQLAVVIQGSIRMGGIVNVWRLAHQGGRINLNQFNPNPLLRASFWIGLLGGFFRVLNPYIGVQFLVQRYSTVSTPRRASLVVYWNLPMFALLVALFWLIGLVMFAMYHDCDPFVDGQVNNRDQMVPLLVIQLLSFLPGIPGLFMACIFSASLSSLSSGYNGSSAIVLKDFITPVYEHFKQKEMSDRLQTNVSKGFAVFFGLLTMGLSFLIMSTGSSIFEMTSKFTGMFGGPIGGVFICGLAIPHLDNASVMSGFALSLILSLWTGIGGHFVAPSWNSLPVFTNGCEISNLSLVNTTLPWESVGSGANLSDNLTTINPLNSSFSTPEPSTGFHLTDIYSLSPLVYGPLSALSAVLFSIVIYYTKACITRACCRSKYHVLKRQTSWKLQSSEDPVKLEGAAERRRPWSSSTEHQSGAQLLRDSPL